MVVSALMDEEVLKMNEEQLRNFRRSKTAMVFQRFALLPHKTVLQNTILDCTFKMLAMKKQKKVHSDGLNVLAYLDTKINTLSTYQVACSNVLVLQEH